MVIYRVWNCCVVGLENFMIGDEKCVVDYVVNGLVYIVDVVL